MLLPLLGAWVGTVLACYFSRENYVAATENNAALLGLTLEQRLQAIQAKSAMIPIAEAGVLKTDKDDGNIKLKDDILDGVVGKSGRNRVPILGADGVVRYVLHRSMIDRFFGEHQVLGRDRHRRWLREESRPRLDYQRDRP